MSTAAIRVGLISDTHGLLRESALQFLRGADLIIHAGDICERRVVEELEVLSPVTVVRGNNDRGEWVRELKETEILRVGDVSICVVHDLAELSVDLKAAGIKVVVSGHSHKPAVQTKDGVLFINPGSAGPRRFSLPISAGELLVRGHDVSGRTVILN